jgi:hypothetical protein
MSKKTLLNEASVRKFMKFAKIDRYTDNFINEMYAPMEEEEAMMEQEDEAPEMGEEAPEMEDDMPAEEAPEMEDEGEGEAMEGTVDLEAFMDAFETALEAATGEDVEVDMGAEAEMGEEAPEMDDEVAGEMEMVDDEEVLEETVRRVTARLSKMVESKKKAANKARMVESITDRIVARILKGE